MSNDEISADARISMALEVVELASSRAVMRLSADQVSLLVGLFVATTYRSLRIENLDEILGVSEPEIGELASELSTIIHRISKIPVDEARKDIRHLGLYGTEDGHATIDVTLDQVRLFHIVAACTFARFEEWGDTHSRLGFWPDEVQSFIDELTSLEKRMLDADDQR